jgi:glutathione S-transferase
MSARLASGPAGVATHKNAAAYLRRLLERPSYARAIAEATPYFSLFPI